MLANSKVRDRSLDALRGLAILSVVLSHVLVRTTIPGLELATSLAIFVLYIFNAQLFGFVAGMLLKRGSLRGKAVSLLVPTATFILLNAVVTGGRVLANIPAQLVAALNGSGMWFLWALFLSFCTVAVLRKRWLLVTAALLLALTWQLVPQWTAEKPFRPLDVLGMVRTLGLVFPYMVFGAYWRRWESKGLQLTAPLTAAALAGFVAVVPTVLWLKATITPTTRGEAIVFVLLVSAVQALGTCLACVGFLGACRRLSGWALGTFAFFGVISIGVYLFHATLIARFGGFFTMASLPELAWKTAALVAASVALTALVSLNEYTSLAFLGRRMSLPLRLPLRRAEELAKDAA